MEVVSHTHKVFLILGMIGFIFGMKHLVRHSVALVAQHESGTGLNFIAVILSFLAIHKIVVF